VAVHAAAYIQQQNQIEQLGILAEVDDLPRTAIVKDREILLRQPRHHAAVVSHHLRIHFHQRHTGVKGWAFAGCLLGECGIRR
jgi:hypothetical protein